MFINDNNIAPLPAKLSGNAPRDASITLKSPTPKEFAGKLVTFKVEGKVEGNPNLYRITGPTGKTIEAEIKPAPQIGSSITVAFKPNGEVKLLNIVPQQVGNNNASKQPQNQNGAQASTNTPQQNNTTGQQQAQKTTTGQPLQTASPEQAQQVQKLLQLVGKTLDAKPLPQQPHTQTPNTAGSAPANSLPKVDVQTLTVVTSPLRLGFQTVQPTASANTAPFQIKFPQEIPVGAQVTVQRTEGAQVKILGLNLNNAQVATAQNVVPSQTQATLSPQQAQNIIQSAVVDKSTLAHLPEGSKIKLYPAVSQPTATAQNTANTTQTLATTGGIPVKIETPVTIPAGSEMTIILNKHGKVDILRIDKDSASGNALNRDPDSATRQAGVVPNPKGKSFQQVIQQEGGAATAQQTANTNNNVRLSNTVALPIGKPVAGVVESQGDNNLILRLAGGGHVQIRSERPLPLGTIITLEATADEQINILNIKQPATSIKLDALHQYNKSWDTLNQALQSLKASAPDKASALQNQLPNMANPAFLLNMLRFMNTVATQDMAKTVDGETLNLLRAMGIDFTPDLTQLHTLQQKSESSEGWRALLFPYYEDTDKDPNQGSLFWKRNEGEDHETNHLRFILNVSLSHLGPMQIDGLMSKNELFLKLYTQNPTLNEYSQDLQNIVKSTLENLGLKGDILIEYGKKPEVDPTQELIEREQTLSVRI